MSCKLRERAQVHKHGLQMINLLEKLQNLEHSVDLILLSLLSSYEGFPMNFNVNKIDILFIRSSRGIDQCWRPMVLPSRTKSPSYLQHHRRLWIKTFIVEEEERKEFKCFIMIYNVVLSWYNIDVCHLVIALYGFIRRLLYYILLIYRPK